jgi:site-specific DNA recombinase
MHAAWGRRAHRLEPDPVTAPVVRWMFAQVLRWNLPEGWVISKHPAHPALVSEADFIAAQDATAPRGPAGSATRRYLLAGLLACGRCGRRLESAWSNGKPAYRCRHGYTSATGPDPARPKNTYVREEQILPHLAAIAILIPGPTQALTRTRGSLTQVTTPAQAADLIDSLYTAGVTLTYDPDRQTLRCNNDIAVTIGNSR